MSTKSVAIQFTSVQKNKQYFSRRVVAVRYVMIAVGAHTSKEKAVKVLEKGIKGDMGTEVPGLMWIA